MSHDHNSAGASHGNTKQYTIGFILSVILTFLYYVNNGIRYFIFNFAYNQNWNF